MEKDQPNESQKYKKVCLTRVTNDFRGTYP